MKLILYLSSIISLTIFVLPACSVNPATGKQSFTPFMSVEQEKIVGAEEHKKILEKFGGKDKNIRLGKYIQEIGLKLAASSENPNLRYKFTVLNDPAVNAFALPGGYVYLTRGLIALAEDEAELAGVIAHEIGHIAARHTAERYSQSVAANIGLTTLGVVGTALGVPSQANRLLSVGTKATLRAYSRTQELEADMLSVRYLKKNGYDPRALVDFFIKLNAQKNLNFKLQGKFKKQIDSFSMMSTHPRTARRIEKAMTLSQRMTHGERSRKRENFLSHVEGVVYGLDKREGIVKGQVFVHPHYGFRYEVPNGFQFQNLKDRVISRNKLGAKIIFDLERSSKLAGNIELIEYLGKNWKTGWKLKYLERMEVNGLKAATGYTSIKLENNDTNHVRQFVIRGNNRFIYRFIFITPSKYVTDLDRKFRHTALSFRLLSPKETSIMQPNRISISTVQPGDTSELLAKRMPFGQFNIEWFKVFNSNVVSDGLSVGERVKLVIE